VGGAGEFDAGRGRWEGRAGMQTEGGRKEEILFWITALSLNLDDLLNDWAICIPLFIHLLRNSKDAILLEFVAAQLL
jgi:hypothetical protein